MVNSLWNVDGGKFHDDDFEEISVAVGDLGKFVVCAAVFSLSPNAGGARPRLTA